MQALLFHAERSTGYGKESDQHSQAQAVRGIYRRGPNSFWVRGPAGLARSTWHKVNAELEQLPWVARPGDPPRVLIRERRKHFSGADAATEYAIDWLAVAGVIQEFKFTAPESCPLLRDVPAIVADDAPGSVHHMDTPYPPGGEGRVHRMDAPPAYGSPPGGHQQRSLDQYREDRTARGFVANERRLVKQWLEDAWGSTIPPHFAHVPGRLLEIAEKIGIHGEALSLWIRHMKVATNREGLDVRTPGFYLSAAVDGTNNLIKWGKLPENRNAIESARLKHQLALQRLASPPTAPLLSMPATPTPEAEAPEVYKLPDVGKMALQKRMVADRGKRKP